MLAIATVVAIAAIKELLKQPSIIVTRITMLETEPILNCCNRVNRTQIQKIIDKNFTFTVFLYFVEISIF